MSKHAELTEAIYYILESSKDFKVVAKSIAAYLLETRQTKNLGAIMRDLESLRLDRDDILELEVKTARPMSDETKKAIKSLFDAKKFIIHEEHDPSQLGGVKVRARDQQFDYSVRTRLQRLKAGV